MGLSYQKTVSDTIALTQNAVANIRRRVSAADSIILYQATYSNYKIQQVSSILELTDLFESNDIISKAVGTAFVLSDNVTYSGAKYSYPFNVLNLTQTVVQNIKHDSIENVIEFEQNLEAQTPIYVASATDATSTITFIYETNITTPWDEVDLTDIDITDLDQLEELFESKGLRQNVEIGVVTNKSATSYLNLSQSAGPGVFVTASNHIHLLDLAESVEYEVASNVLVLTQTVSIDSVAFANNTLNLIDIAIGNLFTEPAPSNDLDLDHIVTFYRANDLCNYDPGVGFGPNAPSMTDPVLTRRSSIILTYPYYNPTLTLELRNPQFDDVEQFEARRVNRKTRGSTLKVFRDNLWPTSERLIYGFDNLCETDRTELLSFMQTSIGKEIGLLDYESRQWKGIITTPTATVEREDRPGWDATIEFEGVLNLPILETICRFDAQIASSLINTSGLQASLTDEIREWWDQSGQSNTITQDTTYPTLQQVTNGDKTFKVLRGNGSNTHLDSVSFNSGILTQPFMRVSVYKLANPTDNILQYLFSQGTNPTVLFLKTASNTIRINAGTSLTGGAFPSGWNILSEVYNGTSSKIYINGEIEQTGDAGSNTLEGLSVLANQAGTSAVNGDVAEVWVFNEELTDENHNLLGNFLGERYGITWVDL